MGRSSFGVPDDEFEMEERVISRNSDHKNIKLQVNTPLDKMQRRFQLHREYLTNELQLSRENALNSIGNHFQTCEAAKLNHSSGQGMKSNRFDELRKRNMTKLLRMSAERKEKEYEIFKLQEEERKHNTTILEASKTITFRDGPQSTTDVVHTTPTRDSKLVLELREISDMIQALKNEFEVVSTNDKFKKNRIQMKMRIQKRIGQVAKSTRQIEIVSKDLIDLLSEAKNYESNIYAFCLIALANKILEQGESQINIFQPAAHSLGLVINMISKVHPLFVKAILVISYEKCPYIGPSVISRNSFSSDEEFRNALGYKKKNSVWESFEVYSERMCGIVGLCAGIICTETNVFFPISRGWEWLANLLNRKPEKISALLISVFLEIAGYSLMRKYRNQFIKLLQYIKDRYLNKTGNLNISASTRLEILVDSTLNGFGLHEKPEGIL